MTEWKGWIPLWLLLICGSLGGWSYGFPDPAESLWPVCNLPWKSGKQKRGYTANIVETVGDNGSIVTNYQYEKNTHSDSQYLKETVESMEKTEEPTVLITDGAYSGRDNTNAAIISTRLDNAGYHFQKTNVKTVHTVTSATPRCLKDQCGFSV